MNNKDVVTQFLAQGRYEVGDTFTLPDIDQVFEVVTVRPFTREGKFFLFLDLASICAVEGCDELLVFPVEANRWKKAYYVTRTCTEHRGCFRSPVKGAWGSTGRSSPLKGKKRGAHKPHVGRVQRQVLDALEALSLVYEKPSRDQVVELVARYMDAPTVGRDTRRFRAERAYDLLVKSGFLSPGAG